MKYSFTKPSWVSTSPLYFSSSSSNLKALSSHDCALWSLSSNSDFKMEMMDLNTFLHLTSILVCVFFKVGCFLSLDLFVLSSWIASTLWVFLSLWTLSWLLSCDSGFASSAETAFESALNSLNDSCPSNPSVSGLSASRSGSVFKSKSESCLPCRMDSFRLATSRLDWLLLIFIRASKNWNGSWRFASLCKLVLRRWFGKSATLKDSPKISK